MLGRGGGTRGGQGGGNERNTVIDGAKEIDAGPERPTGVRREGGGPAQADRPGPRPAHRPGRSRRARRPGRPDVAAALDAEVDPHPAGRPAGHGPQGLAHDGARPARARWATASRPRPRPSRVPSTPTATPSSSTSTPGRGAPGRRRAGGLGRLQEEGAGRRGAGLQERGPGVAAEGRAGTGRRARLPRPPTCPRPSPTASSTWGPTRAGCPSATTTTPPPSPSTPSAAGGRAMGAERYPKAKRLMVTADAGGSNGYRNRLWKVELAKLAAETGLDHHACATTRQAPRSGTKSSTACSASSPTTGGDAPHLLSDRRGADRRHHHRDRPQVRPNGTKAITRRAPRSPTPSSPHLRSTPTTGTASGTTTSRSRSRASRSGRPSSSFSGP